MSRRYLQAEHEVTLENDLIGFSGLVRCQQNAFKHAFSEPCKESLPTGLEGA